MKSPARWSLAQLQMHVVDTAHSECNMINSIKIVTNWQTQLYNRITKEMIIKFGV